MVIVLKKLTNGAILSPSEAAEEFRGGVFRCLRALLLSLHMCSNKSCSCKQIIGWPALSKRSEFQSPISRDTIYNSEQECLLAFLQSQTASAAVGHWLSLLLKACVVYFIFLVSFLGHMLVLRIMQLFLIHP